jgi:hypothetical protein
VNKKTIVKYAYFTVLLLLPLALVFFPVDAVNPFKLFLAIPYAVANIILTNFETAIYCILFMSINFFIASKLYKIYKEKPESIKTCLAIVLFLFFIVVPYGGDMRAFIVYFYCGIFTFCPLYFFGILYYHRYVNKGQKEVLPHE